MNAKPLRTISNYNVPTVKNIKTQKSEIMVELPQVKLEVARKSFYFQGANLYNKQPREIRLEKALQNSNLIKIILY